MDMKRKKKHISDHFRVENYMVWKIRRQEQFSFTIPPALGWHEAFLVPQRLDSSWGIMAPLTTADGLLCQLLLVVLGLSYTPDQQPGLPQPLLRWAWPLSTGDFSNWRFLNHFSTISQTMQLDQLHNLGLVKAQGQQESNHTQPGSSEANCTGWGLKDTLF